jgi:hypothetical protein
VYVFHGGANTGGNLPPMVNTGIAPLASEVHSLMPMTAMPQSMPLPEANCLAALQQF